MDFRTEVLFTIRSDRFAVPEKVSATHPAGAEILNRIAAGLRAQGFAVGSVGGASLGVGMSVKGARTGSVGVLLLASRRRPGVINCSLSTSYWPPFWKRELGIGDDAPPAGEMEHWRRLCEAIFVEVLALGPVDAFRLTEDEANAAPE